MDFSKALTENLLLLLAAKDESADARVAAQKALDELVKRDEAPAEYYCAACQKYKLEPCINPGGPLGFGGITVVIIG